MKPVIVGAVLYDPKVSVIWDIIRNFFESRGVAMDVVYFTNYELQVSAMLNGTVEVAWNSPLAWLDAQRRSGDTCRAIAMRDTDRGRCTHIIVGKDSGISSPADLRGKTVAFGAVDSPQATLIPKEHLRREGLAEAAYTARRFDIAVGKHGDHIGGELDAFRCLERGEADAMICGLEGRFDAHLAHIADVIGVAPGVRDFSALSLIIMSNGAYFLADTHVTTDPTAEEVADMAILSAEQVCRFGMTPKIALLSHSAFGSRNTQSAEKMRDAVNLIREKAPQLEVEGEMHGDAALDEAYRRRVYPLSTLSGEANMLIMPNLDAANIVYQLLKTVGNALPVGPILLGAAKPAHVLTPSVTARGVVNMTAIAAVEAQCSSES